MHKPDSRYVPVALDAHGPANRFWSLPRNPNPIADLLAGLGRDPLTHDETADAWGIPKLDISFAADSLIAPVTKWGTRRRTAPMPGTWHFYAWDYVFTHLQRYPDMVPNTGCQVAVEPNYTITPDTPAAEALWKVYLKRLLASTWQKAGVRIVVDLNLDSEGKYHEIGLLGVPVGWPAYATRAHRGVPFEQIEREFDLAARHARGDVRLFCVFGGGRKVKAACKARGWQHAPEHRQVVKGAERPYGQD